MRQEGSFDRAVLPGGRVDRACSTYGAPREFPARARGPGAGEAR